MTQTLIQIDNLSHHYPDRNATFDGVNFVLNEGDRVALLGANGAGKTTLFKLIMGLIKPTSGVLTIFDQMRSTERDFVEVRRRIGYLFQDSDDQLFCPTVLEDVCFGPLNLGKSQDEAVSIATQTLQSLALDGYEQRVTHQLSGGEKRLVALASVLAMKPDILLLDEPTNALDDTARRYLLDCLHILPQSMIIISHDQTFIDQLCSRKAVLSREKIVL